MIKPENRILKGIFLLLLFLSVVLSCTILKIMDSFFRPVVLAVLLSFVLYPAIKQLNKKAKVPWWLSILIVYLVFIVFFVLITNLLTSSFKSIIQSIPRYEERFSNLQYIIKKTYENHSDSGFFLLFDFNTEESFFSNINNQFNILGFVKDFALNFTSSVVSFMKTIFLVILLSLFLLTEIRKFRGKLSKAFTSNDKEKVHSIVRNIISDVTHYISIKFVISLLTGIAVTLICLISGMDFPLIWGFVAFILNFIPTFGSIISCGITILFAILQFYPSILTIVIVSVFLIAVNLFLGNILEPKMEGQNLGISPFFILINLSFWGWMWGVLGMILAVPFMVIIKIISENISFLKPFAVLIGTKA